MSRAEKIGLALGAAGLAVSVLQLVLMLRAQPPAQVQR